MSSYIKSLHRKYGVSSSDMTPTDPVPQRSLSYAFTGDGGLVLSRQGLHTEEIGDSGIRYVNGVATNTEANPAYAPVIVRGSRTQPGLYRELQERHWLIRRAMDDVVEGLQTGSWDVITSGEGPYHERIRQKVEDALEGLSPSLDQLASEILEARTLGFSLFEPVFYGDGRIREINRRMEHAVSKWLFDDGYRELVGAELSRGDLSTYVLDAPALAIARHRPEGIDPEGRSVLRPVAALVEAWELLVQIEIAVGEKRGGGYLAIEAERTLSEEEVSALQGGLEYMLATDSPYIVLPDGVRLNLHSPAGQMPDFSEAKSYLDRCIAVALGVEYALVGTGDTGSYALASAKNDEARSKLKAHAGLIESFFNSRSSHLPYRGIIPRMVDAWGVPEDGIYPRLIWTPPARDKDYSQITAMVQAGLLSWSEADEEKLREELGLDPLPVKESSPITTASTPTLRLSRKEPDADGIKRLLKASENRMGHLLRRVGGEHRDAFVGLTRGVTDPSEVLSISERLRDHFRPLYIDAVRDEIARVVAQGSGTVLYEMGVLKSLPRIPSEPQAAARAFDVDLPEARSIIDATAERIGDKAYNVTTSYLVDRGVQESEGAQERSKPAIPTLSAYTKHGGELIARPFSWGREQVAQRIRNHATAKGLPSGIIAERSSVLEDDTCDPCARLDGVRAVVGSARYDELTPPNKCEGGDRCRCIWTYIMPDEAGYEDILDDLIPGWRQGDLNLARPGDKTQDSVNNDCGTETYHDPYITWVVSSCLI